MLASKIYWVKFNTGLFFSICVFLDTLNRRIVKLSDLSPFTACAKILSLTKLGKLKRGAFALTGFIFFRKKNKILLLNF